MTKYRFLLILTAIFAVFSLCVCATAAQDINVNDMDNDQLMVLLQAIMQRLETEGTDPETDTEPTAEIRTIIPSVVIESVRTFRVYENKKLIIESLPSYYFINPTAEPDEPETPGKEKPTDSCHENCGLACYGISYECYYNCYKDCSGGKEPPPPKG